jgi:hypothetical protein
MICRHATAFALLSWTLIAPPNDAWTIDATGGAVMVLPEHEWIRLKAFDTKGECEEILLKVKADRSTDRSAWVNELAECIATDDPRLKGNKSLD